MVFAEKVQARGLSARAQAQSICYKLKGGLAVRRACYGGLKFIMDNGNAKGVQIIISGKLRGARAKAMKFKEGYMITSGEAKKQYIVEAVEHVLLRQGTIGVRVTIMLPHDPEGRGGVKDPLPDVVIVNNPKTYDDDDDGYMPNDDRDMGYAEQTYNAGPPQQQQQLWSCSTTTIPTNSWLWRSSAAISSTTTIPNPRRRLRWLHHCRLKQIANQTLLFFWNFFIGRRVQERVSFFTENTLIL